MSKDKLQLRSVDIITLLDGGIEVIKRAKLPSNDKDADGLPVGTLLSDKESTPFYVHYHLSTVHTESKTLVHVRLLSKPQSSPPRPLIKSRDNGDTLEKFLSTLSDVFGKKTVGIVDVVANAYGALRPRPPIAAPPVKVGGQLLEFTGAEFEARKRDQGGVQSISWKNRHGSDSDDIKITYTGEIRWSRTNVWQGTAKHCRELLASLT